MGRQLLEHVEVAISVATGTEVEGSIQFPFMNGNATIFRWKNAENGRADHSFDRGGNGCWNETHWCS